MNRVILVVFTILNLFTFSAYAQKSSIVLLNVANQTLTCTFNTEKNNTTTEFAEEDSIRVENGRVYLTLDDVVNDQLLIKSGFIYQFDFDYNDPIPEIISVYFFEENSKVYAHAYINGGPEYTFDCLK